MPILGSSNDTRALKVMCIGHSGSGKTGALVSLVQAGYKLRIADFDMGLDILYHKIQEVCPDKLQNVGYMPFRDNMKMTPAGPVPKGAPKAFANFSAALDKWEDDTNPAEWDRDTILVVDSLTAVGRSAFIHARAMNPGAREPRTWFYAAQEMIDFILAGLTNEAFNPNVIVNTHIDIRESKEDGTTKGFPSSIGAALGPKIPTYFNNLFLFDQTGTGANVKRSIRTTPTTMVSSVKVPKKAEATYPIETGLATLFKLLRT